MELPFNIIELIAKINDEPMILVIFASFHPLAFLVLFIPFGIFNKTKKDNQKKEISSFWYSIILIFMIGWILGFVSQILFLFMEIPGIKMLAIYLSMYLCITAFVLFNVSLVKKQLSKVMDLEKIKKR